MKMLLLAVAIVLPSPVTAAVSRPEVNRHGAIRALSVPTRVERPALQTRLRRASLSAEWTAPLYVWREGGRYTVATAPERVTDLALQPGEALLSVAAGDTARWIIGDTASGSGAARRTHLLVKPAGVGLRTNLVIATDRRVYHVDLESSSRAAMTSVTWTYPDDALLALRRSEAAAARAQDAVVGSEIAVERLNFNYRIEGDRPAWRPLRAFDDGTQTFIEFPQTLVSGEAPPLFALDAKGRAELVNYRRRGNYYVVDRLFERAELRLGARPQQVVRLVRGGGRRAGGGR